jgi:16S rRNA (adenine1518-N6/adenine1519-N6)-dimethyltransferase
VSPLIGKQAGLTSTSSRHNSPRYRSRSSRPYRPHELRGAGISPAKSLGQHFLTDYTYVNRIVAAAELTKTDTVIEIGPGLGVLTEKLAAEAGKIVAIELDAALADRLRAQFATQDHVRIVRGNALEVAPTAMLTSTAFTLSSRGEGEQVEGVGAQPDTGYIVVGNLPYNVGTAIVRRFLEAEHPPSRLIVMLQREVAESMTVPMGEMGLLGISVQVYARARKLFNVPPRAFYPPPKVTSSVIRLDLREQPLIPSSEGERFFRVVRAGFSAPRKQLRNTLAQGLGLDTAAVRSSIEEVGLDPSLRPQQLRIEDWLALSRQLQPLILRFSKEVPREP